MAKSIYERVRAAQAAAAKARENLQPTGISQAQINREELREAAVQTWYDENDWLGDPSDHWMRPSERELREIERRLRSQRRAPAAGVRS